MDLFLPFQIWQKLCRINEKALFKDTIYTATIPNTVLRDRTYGTAVALKMELEKWDLGHTDFDLYTMGAHARRSHLMYRKAFHDGRHIGLIRDTDPSFDAKHGIKQVADSDRFHELISYFYSALFFPPQIIEHLQGKHYKRALYR